MPDYNQEVEANQFDDDYLGIDDYFYGLEDENNQVVQEGSRNTNKELLEGDNPVSNEDLVSRLMQLYSFYDNILKTGYYGGKEGITKFSLSAIQSRYDNVFSGVEFPVTVAMAQDFLDRIKAEDFRISSLWRADVETLKLFFDSDPNKVEVIKNDGLAYIARREKYDSLNTLSAEIEKLSELYNNIADRTMALDATKEDVSTVESLLNYCTDFSKQYTESPDQVIKEVFENNFNIIKDLIPVYEDFLKVVPGYLTRTEKKGGPQGDNPTLSKEGGSYIEPGKAGKEDKPIQGMHKYWKTYDKKLNEYSIFKQGKKDLLDIEMNDAKQGMLGDCYLISAIASVARKMPEHIRSLISYTKGSSKAIVTLYILDPKTMKREPKPIEVDFNFPQNEFLPSYADKGDDELWVMLIEKAFAKEKGGYDNIISGSPKEALSVLTGKDTSYVETDSETIKDDLKNSIGENKASVVGTKTAKKINEMGKPEFNAVLKENSTSSYIVKLSGDREIVCAHAYSLLNYSEGDDKIEIRNPHGGENDTFFVTLEEFKACFSGVYVSELK